MIIDKDWIFSSDEYSCDLRAAGVLIKNNKILVQREKNRNEYDIPGGHIKIGKHWKTGLFANTRKKWE